MDLSSYENQQVETEAIATAGIFFGQSAGIFVIAVRAPASKQANRATIQHMLTYMVTTTCLLFLDQQSSWSSAPSVHLETRREKKTSYLFLCCVFERRTVVPSSDRRSKKPCLSVRRHGQVTIASRGYGCRV